MRMTAITKIGSIVCDVMVAMLTCSWTHLYKSRVRSDAWHVSSRYKQNSKPSQCTVTVPVHHDPWIWSTVLFLRHFYLFVHLVVATEWKLQWTKKMLLQKTHLQCWPTIALHSRTAQIIKSCKLNPIQSKTSLVQYRVAVAILW